MVAVQYHKDQIATRSVGMSLAHSFNARERRSHFLRVASATPELGDFFSRRYATAQIVSPALKRRAKFIPTPRVEINLNQYPQKARRRLGAEIPWQKLWKTDPTRKCQRAAR